MDKEKRHKILNYVFLAAIIISIGIALYTYNEMLTIHNILEERKSSRGELSNITAMMEEIQSIYDEEYIGDRTNQEDIEDKALLGFTLGHNDKYGYYTSPEQTKKEVDARLEKMVGIGIVVVYEEGKGYYITNVYENSPAEDSGIKIGDYITSVDGIEIEDSNANELLEHIRGEVETYANIGITNENGTTEKQVQRKDVKANSVSGTSLDDIAYLKINKFTEYTDEEFIEKVKYYKSVGHDKFIFDLRNNPGGSADTVINMLDYLLPEGLIASFKYKNIEDDLEYYSGKSEVTGSFVVLVNQNTASASELFSKALQEYDKATVVGTTTFGKGTVLSTYTLSNGGALTLSTAKYYTKSGEELEGIGVKPDIKVSLSKEKESKLYRLSVEEDEQLQKAIEILN